MKTNYSVNVFMRYDKISKKKKDAPVVIQIYRDGEKTQKTIFRIKPEYWDEENLQVRKSHPNSMEKNFQIKQSIADCEELAFNTIKANAEFGVNQIRNNIHQRITHDFFEFADSYLENLQKNGSISLYHKDKAIIHKFKIFIKKETLPINKFNSGLIKKYEQYLLEEKGNCRNTVTTNMKRLARYVRLMYKKHKLDKSQFPFEDYEMITEKTERSKLTKDELSRIMNLKYTPVNPLYDVKQFFLFESLTGIRIGDILKLKWKNYRRHKLSFIMTKTREPMKMKLGDIVMKIISMRISRNKIKNGGNLNPNDYIFNILPVDVDKASEKVIHNAIKSTTAIINKRLKKIAVDAKINKNLSTHLARHINSSFVLIISKL